MEDLYRCAIAMGPLNYLPTRHSLAALLVAGGQIVLFGSFLGIKEPCAWLPIALTCFVVAALLVAVKRRTQFSTDATLAEHANRWLGFRDAFGAFWGLRIIQRVNETATLCHWPVRLVWSGFEQVRDEDVTQAQVAEIDQMLDTLLRRFL